MVKKRKNKKNKSKNTDKHKQPKRDTLDISTGATDGPSTTKRGSQTSTLMIPQQSFKPYSGTLLGKNVHDMLDKFSQKSPNEYISMLLSPGTANAVKVKGTLVSEDSIGAFVSPESTFLVIADGHWGDKASELAINVSVEFAAKNINLVESGDMMATNLLLRLITLISEVIFKTLLPDGALRHINNLLQKGDTLAADASADALGHLIAGKSPETSYLATLIHNNLMHYVSYGDSFLYLFLDNRSFWARQINQTNKTWLGILSALGLLDRESVYDALDMGTVRLHKGDRILLATDGLQECIYDVETLTVKDMEKIVYKNGNNVIQTATMLMNEALRTDRNGNRGGEDNVGLILYEHPQAQIEEETALLRKLAEKFIEENKSFRNKYVIDRIMDIVPGCLAVIVRDIDSGIEHDGMLTFLEYFKTEVEEARKCYAEEIACASNELIPTEESINENSIFLNVEVVPDGYKAIYTYLGDLSDAKKVEILRQLANTLEKLEESGIYHNSITPSEVLYSESEKRVMLKSLGTTYAPYILASKEDVEHSMLIPDAFAATNRTIFHEEELYSFCPFVHPSFSSSENKLVTTLYSLIIFSLYLFLEDIPGSRIWKTVGKRVSWSQKIDELIHKYIQENVGDLPDDFIRLLAEASTMTGMKSFSKELHNMKMFLVEGEIDMSTVKPLYLFRLTKKGDRIEVAEIMPEDNGTFLFGYFTRGKYCLDVHLESGLQLKDNDQENDNFAIEGNNKVIFNLDEDRYLKLGVSNPGGIIDNFKSFNQLWKRGK